MGAASRCIDLLGMVDCAGRGQAATLLQRSCLLSYHRARNGGALMADPAVNWTADELDPCRNCAAGAERWTRLEADPGALAAFNEFAAASETKFKAQLVEQRAAKKKGRADQLREKLREMRSEIALAREARRRAEELE